MFAGGCDHAGGGVVVAGDSVPRESQLLAGDNRTGELAFPARSGGGAG